MEVAEITVEGPQPVIKMILHIARKYEEVFPKLQGKRRLHPHEFDTMLEQIRAMFWDYRLVDVEYDASHYVAERIPLGSEFHNDLGYTTPDGTSVPVRLRNRVNTLRQGYRRMQQIQQKYQEDEITYPTMQRQYTEALREWEMPYVGTPKEQPTWKGVVLKEVCIETKGLIRTEILDGKVRVTPKAGPRNWEVTLTKNGQGPLAGAASESF